MGGVSADIYRSSRAVLSFARVEVEHPFQVVDDRGSTWNRQHSYGCEPSTSDFVATADAIESGQRAAQIELA